MHARNGIAAEVSLSLCALDGGNADRRKEGIGQRPAQLPPAASMGSSIRKPYGMRLPVVSSVTPEDAMRKRTKGMGTRSARDFQGENTNAEVGERMNDPTYDVSSACFSPGRLSKLIPVPIVGITDILWWNGGLRSG